MPMFEIRWKKKKKDCLSQFSKSMSSPHQELCFSTLTAVSMTQLLSVVDGCRKPEEYKTTAEYYSSLEKKASDMGHSLLPSLTDKLGENHPIVKVLSGTHMSKI